MLKWLKDKVVEEAFIAGVLHDIGKLILLRAPVLYKEGNGIC